MRKGFTLVELLVVLLIVVLFTVVLIVVLPVMSATGNPRVPSPVNNVVSVAPDVYEFGVDPERDHDDVHDGCDATLKEFLNSHGNLRLKCLTGTDYDYHGRPRNYVIITETIPR